MSAQVKPAEIRGTHVPHPTTEKTQAEMDEHLRAVIAKEVRVSMECILFYIGKIDEKVGGLRSDNYQIHEIVRALKETMRELPSVIRDEVHTALHLPPPNDDPPPMA
jgi:hypothetical protein